MSQVQRYLDSIRKAMARYGFGSSRANGKQTSVTVIIPTMNSAGHLDITLGYYRRMGVSPVIFVDAKSTDDTFGVASRSCEHVHLTDNPGEWVECMIEHISRSVATEWVLRIDDDELPSRAILEMCGAGLSGVAQPIVSFPRRNCGLTRCRQFAFDGRSDEDRQFRLYRVNEVQYSTAIHTPALIIERSVKMVNPHFLIHFDWAVHSYEERKSKVDRYNRVGGFMAGDRFRKGILFEDDSELAGARVVLDAPEFMPVAEALANRFPKSCML